MTIEELHQGVIRLLPYRDDTHLPFRQRLANALSQYRDLVAQYSDDDALKSDILYISNRLKDIVSNYEKGLQSTSFIQLQNLIQGRKGLPPKIDLARNILALGATPQSFYRIRLMDSIYGVEAHEMFHIPLNMRGMVKTQRYSASGYPCLYLGESIYGCWEEMRRPDMQKCAVSRLECGDALNIIDLTLPTVDDLLDPERLKLIPLLISCMIPVVNHADTYKPEYIIPQLIIEWVLKNRRTKNIDGVCYTSTHINDEFDYPADKFINYAIPVYSTDIRNKYCKRLCRMFRITRPTTDTLEQLKCNYPDDGGRYGLSPDELREQNYRTSHFGNLETRLQNTTKFPLITLNHK